MDKLIKIIETNSQQVLYQYDLDQLNECYKQAKELEELDIDFIVEIPSIVENLGKTLNMSDEDIETAKKIMICEINDHN